MSQSFRASSGKVVRLGQVLGKGGEGTVYAIEGDNQLAAKIYLPGLAKDRREKIAAMVQAGWHKAASFVAFPIDTLSDQTGKFSGFTMRRVGGDKPIHQLYSPAGRKTAFPTASYPFLIRTVSNVARAIASVNATGCIVGDVNHSGVLVSKDASITLIDCDSFHVPFSGQVFPCKVGVPEFTPPELQGKPLDRILRTANHDSFGLAVLIFYTMMMGRHPFAGRYLGSDTMTMEKAIAEYRFAYSARRAATQTEPPPNVPTLADLPLSLADAFESAFGPIGASKRPAAADWIKLLDSAEKDLVRCSQVQVHHYFRNAPSCPWCRMEAAYPGFLAFVPTTPILVAGAPNLGNLIAAIRGTPDPGPAPDLVSLMPTLPAMKAASSVLEARRARMVRWAGGIACAGIGISLLGTKSPGPLGGIAALGGSAFLAFSKPDTYAAIEKSAQHAELVWRDTVQSFAQQAGNGQFQRARQEAESLINQVQGLASEEQRELSALSGKRRDAQMHRHLERYPIDNVKIKGIGNARKLTLKSYGIETAADVETHRILAIHGFGQATASALLSWRRSAENHFKFNPNEPVSPTDIAAIKANFSRRRADGEARLRQAATQLQRSAAEANALRKQAAQKGMLAWTALKQAETDIGALNSTGKIFGVGIAIVAVGLLLVAVLPKLELPSAADRAVVSRPTIPPPAPTRPEPYTIPRVPPTEAQRPNTTTQDRGSSPSTTRPTRDATQPELLPSGPPISTPPAEPKPPKTASDSGAGQVDAPIAAAPTDPPTANAPPLPPPIEIGEPHRGIAAGGASVPPFEVQPPPVIQARRDPSKLSDALWIQGRLRALGYYAGQERNWGALSREALRNFKATNGLSLDDRWDEPTEARLAGNLQIRAEQTFLGGWASSPNECLSEGIPLQPLRISSRRAQSDGGTCEFSDIQREEGAWRVRANCVVGSERWPATIRFTVAGKLLTWASGKGTETYYRCK
jgi:DNA-binding helix-hairpin-helix protein with protein kinase domain